MNVELPLETWLQKDHGPNKFPENNNYAARYERVKEWMHENVFKHIGVGLTANDGKIYTSHGPDHFDKVIQYAGCLLGLGMDGKGDVKGLSPYEAYVLLVAILLHDSGNLFGRNEHEKRAHIIFQRMGDLAGTTFERRIIADIAKAHGGTTINGDKDTIGLLKKTGDISGHPIRPRLIAAIVRFADEICEDHTRAASLLLESDKIPEDNIIFHKYAEAIQNVHVDIPDESIEITFDILIDDLKHQYILEKNDSGEIHIFLVDMIIHRLAKMDQERRYCMRFMPEVASMTKIRGRLNIVDSDRMEILKKKDIIIQESGYPSTSYEQDLLKEHMDWSGQTLADWVAEQESVDA